MTDDTTPAASTPPAAQQEPTAAPAETDSVPRRPFPTRLLVGGLIGLGATLLVGWATLPLYVQGLPAPVAALARPLIPTLPGDPALAALQAELADLRGAVATLRGSVEQTRTQMAALSEQRQPAPPPGSGLSAERLAALEALVAETAARAPASVQDDLKLLSAKLDELAASRAPAAAVLSLGDRVTEVEALARRAISRQDRALALLLAVAQLREAVDTGRPYAVALKTVQAVAPAGLDVETLTSGFSPLAERGVQTEGQLRQQLSAQAAAIVRAGVLPDDPTPWWSQALDQIAALISVRRLDGQAEGDGPASVVSRAEAALADGALTVAVSELSRLTGRPAAVVAPWLEQGRARLAAQTAIDDLLNEALARLAAESSPAQPAGAGG